MLCVSHSSIYIVTFWICTCMKNKHTAVCLDKEKSSLASEGIGTPTPAVPLSATYVATCRAVYVQYVGLQSYESKKYINAEKKNEYNIEFLSQFTIIFRVSIWYHPQQPHSKY